MSSPDATPRPPRRRRRLVAIGALAGPGLIAANAGNDAGGIATYASAGAEYAYRTLSFMVLVTVALVVVQEMSARLGAYTGEGLVSLIREQFPLRVAAFAVACLVAANLGLVVSEFAGIGAALELLGVSRYLTIPASALVIWGVVVLGSYRWAERAFLLLSLAFLSYLVAAFLGHPDWPAIARQSVLPDWVASRGFLFLGVALIGTTITPYMQLYQAAAVADKGIGPAEYPAARVDAIGGSIAANVVSCAIIIATAAAIGGTGPLGSAADAARALEPVAGPAARHLFAVGLLGASALAAAVVPLATAYALAEAIGVERAISRRFREAPAFFGIFTGLIVVGALIALAPGNLISFLINVQVLNGIITPIILTFILVLANRTSVLGSAANQRWFRILATTCVSAVGILAAIVASETIVSWASSI